MSQRAVDLAALGLEQPVVEIGIEQRSQRLEAYPEHAAGSEAFLLGARRWQAKSRAERFHVRSVGAPEVAQWLQVAFRSHQTKIGLATESIEDAEHARGAGERVHHLPAPLATVTPVEGALGVQLEDQRF